MGELVTRELEVSLQRLAGRGNHATPEAEAQAREALLAAIRQMPHRRPARRTFKRAVIGFMAAALIGGGVAVASGMLTHESYERTKGLAGPSLGSDLDLPQARWDPSAASPGERAELTVESGERWTEGCGSDSVPGSMLVLTPDGSAYCILGIDTDNPEAVFEARAIAQRLITVEVPSEEELEILRLRVRLSYESPDSEEANRIRERLDELWRDLTPDQRSWLAD